MEIKIPNTLDDAMIELLLDISTEDIDAVKSGEASLGTMHHGMGRWLRNNWGLWAGSNLRTHFFDMGIHHADDMSGIILESLVCKIKGEPFDLQKKVEYYRKFWADQDVDVDAEIERLKRLDE